MSDEVRAPREDRPPMTDDPYRPRTHRDAAGVLWVPVEADPDWWLTDDALRLIEAARDRAQPISDGSGSVMECDR